MVVDESFELVIKNMPKEEKEIKYIQKTNKILEEITQVKIKDEDVTPTVAIKLSFVVMEPIE